MIRIAYITLAMTQGGIESLIISLCKGMDKSRFDIYIYCLDSGGELLEIAGRTGVTTRIFTRKSGFDIKLIRSLYRQFRHDGIDIIHTHNEAANFYGCIAGRLGRVPVIINTEHSRHYIDGARKRRIEKLVLSFFTDKMVVVSDQLRNAALKKDRIAAVKLHVIVNGVDVDCFAQAASGHREKIREELNISSNAKVVSIIARLHPIKNHILLLHAVKKITDKMFPVAVLVAGDGEEKKHLENSAAELGLSDSVIFLGNRLDIPEILKASDVLVLCSKTEGLPLVLLEGMSASVPVVATSGANKGKIIQDGINGLVCDETSDDLSEKISFLLSEHRKSEMMAKAAYQMVSEKYSISNTIRNYTDLYLGCLSRKGAEYR